MSSPLHVPNKREKAREYLPRHPGVAHFKAVSHGRGQAHPRSVIAIMARRFLGASPLGMANLGGGGQIQESAPTSNEADYSGEWAI